MVIINSLGSNPLIFSCFTFLSVSFINTAEAKVLKQLAANKSKNSQSDILYPVVQKGKWVQGAAA